ncbi:hypothetical protein CDAR_466581 [Caerostris darwini]|uniref:BHLH domain-containing protein n=1 Tax=Caerostris darwini TaxID=1538125 RepID=A0AAV4T3U6_9ARAC|nr:hypothetical protein CDAR_466581 [Caerostris darwini]
MLDYNFGNIHQEKPARTSHSAEGADFYSGALTNRTSTCQSSTFPQSMYQESHWDVNSTADTNDRYATSNKEQNENFDDFNSSQSTLIPATQHFENSDCTSGIKNPAMPFFGASYTSVLNPVEQPCTNNSAFMQHYPNLSFYNQLPPNCPGSSNVLNICDPTKENYNVPMNIVSRHSSMQDFEMSRSQEKECDALTFARKSNIIEKKISCASDLNTTSINVKCHGNPHAEKKSRKKIQPRHKIAEMDDLLRTIADFRNKFGADFPTNHDVLSTTLNGPLQGHLEVPDPGAAIEVEVTNSPLTTVPLYNSEADHC